MVAGWCELPQREAPGQRGAAVTFGELAATGGGHGEAGTGAVVERSRLGNIQNRWRTRVLRFRELGDGGREIQNERPETCNRT